MPYEKPGKIAETVNNLRSIPLNELTIMSQKLLSLSEVEQQVFQNVQIEYFQFYIPNTCFFSQEFIAKNSDRELQRLPTIVAMETILRNSSGPNNISFLVIASESGEIIILDAKTSTVLQHVRDSSDNNN